VSLLSGGEVIIMDKWRVVMIFVILFSFNVILSDTYKIKTDLILSEISFVTIHIFLESKNEIIVVMILY